MFSLTQIHLTQPLHWLMRRGNIISNEANDQDATYTSNIMGIKSILPLSRKALLKICVLQPPKRMTEPLPTCSRKMRLKRSLPIMLQCRRSVNVVSESGAYSTASSNAECEDNPNSDPSSQRTISVSLKSEPWSNYRSPLSNG